MDLLGTVEQHLRRSGVAPSTFGRAAVGDPRLVFDLRRGRCCGDAMLHRVLAFIQAQREQGR